MARSSDPSHSDITVGTAPAAAATQLNSTQLNQKLSSFLMLTRKNITENALSSASVADMNQIFVVKVPFSSLIEVSSRRHYVYVSHSFSLIKDKDCLSDFREASSMSCVLKTSNGMVTAARISSIICELIKFQDHGVEQLYNIYIL
ncbi:unnamed protein product [Ceratitis capitata]|uniref:(Mediterranean fruit fly) hypothetical protein n=1 Tax=Ceratitis capitata TaxID=7213 RepID=A0A811TYE4_CERCA|nr:unnamed protein product [Ceratitis capitata]